MTVTRKTTKAVLFVVAMVVIWAVPTIWAQDKSPTVDPTTKADVWKLRAQQAQRAVRFEQLKQQIQDLQQEYVKGETDLREKTAKLQKDGFTLDDDLNYQPVMKEPQKAAAK